MAREGYTRVLAIVGPRALLTDCYPGNDRASWRQAQQHPHTILTTSTFPGCSCSFHSNISDLLATSIAAFLLREEEQRS